MVLPNGKHTPPADLADRLIDNFDAPLEGGYYDSEEVPAPVPVWKPPSASKFTPDRCAAIVEAVRAGAFAHVAAAANGIKAATLRRWRQDPCALDQKCTPERCSDRRIHDAKRQFADELAQAEGVARVSAEHRVHAEKPTIWLRLGPGRDRGDPSKPGWTMPPRQIEGTHKHAHAHLHASADGGELRARHAPDLSMLSAAELAQLQAITAKLLPAGVKRGAIEIGEPTED